VTLAKMKLAKIWRDQQGASAVEFALIAPVFFLFIFGIVACGLLFWTQIGMQHGAEMAARCASINGTLCPSSNPGAITGYAMQQTLGLSLPASTFTYSTPACGNQVNASYAFQFPDILNLAPLTLTAQSCFPA
jgi:Flp pilus assembly protein TadG